ncbi:hypothetical protein M9458_041663 [Cirrhinus mrigala]|uniref:BED-type domain-containing protein n=1 Tax=Cirrhinus mrigala TaxID=683832 RepID=A0ABD0NLR0_CIRMR
MCQHSAMMEDVKKKLASGDFKTTENEGKSAVWKYFYIVVKADSDEPVGYVQCKGCGVLMTYDSKRTRNSALQRHVDGGCKSPGLLQPSITTFTSTSRKIPQQAKQKLTEKCVEYCCKDIRPFRSIEGGGFVELAQQLINVGATYGSVAAQDVLPDPTTVSKRCRELATEKRKKLVEQLNDVLTEVNSIGMTTNIWTEDYHKLSYMTITCHFVTQTFKMISTVLTTAAFPLEEAKTGENIRREIIRLLTEYGLDMSLLNKVVWVTDQGSNIISALRPYRRLDCQDHLYNTVMRHALDPTQQAQDAPTVAETLQATKALVKYVKKTGMAALLSKTVIQMADTRFSTVYLTLNSVKSVYQELREKLNDRAEGWRIDAISPDVLDFLVEFLQPFYDTQRELEGDQYPTINLVFLWFERLKRHCNRKTTDSPYQAIIRERHLSWILRKVEIQELKKIATFLWPKYSQLRMFSSSERDNLHLEVRRQLKDLHNIEEAAEGPAPKKAAVDFEEWENVPVADATDEVERYSTHNHAMQDDRDVLGWWRDQQLNYPKLSVLARGILAIPASSSSSERNFSAAGRTIEQKRTALKPSTVDAILFLHKNMD